jgi:DNA-binding MarR family transcriptional regulator
MIEASPLSRTAILEVRDSCLCLAAQRAARRLGRRFDRALQPVGLTNGQYSALMFIAGKSSQSVVELGELLAMDRTSVTALLKPLRRRELIEIGEGAVDRRRRCVTITPSGRLALEQALTIWRREHAALEDSLPADAAPPGRGFLRALSEASSPPMSGRRSAGAPSPGIKDRMHF